MHSLFTTFFAALFSFGHGSAVHHIATVDNPFLLTHSYTAPAPSRQQLALSTTLTSYSGSACSSCRLMNASYTVR